MRFSLILTSLLLSFSVFTQPILKPGFEANEYLDLLSLAYFSSSIPDTAERVKTKDRYSMQYRSPEVGLLNRWTLYLRDDNVGTIDVRGTIGKLTSWLANFYAAMIPATGTLQLNDSSRFEYQLANNPNAMVHVGWTISLGYLGPDIVQKINALYKDKNVKEFLLFGHSQGGAITLLLRSYLHYEMQKGRLPKDLVFKTYCSAAPKVGNMYYAYDYDFITRNYWAHTVVNASDWVPETPFTVQTIKDFNPGNPFENVKPVLKKQKLIFRVAGNSIYNKIDRATTKAQYRFEKYLGRKMYSKAIKKQLPQLNEPGYSDGNNYMRAGTPVVLQPDAEYLRMYITDTKKPFTHHNFGPYSYLVKKYYGGVGGVNH